MKAHHQMSSLVVMQVDRTTVYSLELRQDIAYNEERKENLLKTHTVITCEQELKGPHA